MSRGMKILALIVSAVILVVLGFLLNHSGWPDWLCLLIMMTLVGTWSAFFEQFVENKPCRL
jgi:RsiW-degrading membrane proteinase PrsW (M82 family)